MQDGAAIYYDGETARRRAARVILEDDGLVIDEAGIILARWRYTDLVAQDAADGFLRLSARSARELARLEIADAAAIAGLKRRAPGLDAPARTKPRETLRIVAWSIAAAASLIASAWLLVPLIADRLAPLVPPSLETRLGDVVDRQVRGLFGDKTCASPTGSAALDKLTARLNAVADLPMPVSVAVIDNPKSNAFALPGGRIYLLKGLLPSVANVDELAGVLAHEMGHVAHRDGLRKLMQTGGTSFLLGLMFGDVTGSGAIIMAGRMLLDSSYSRDTEAAADAFAAEKMVALGRPAQPLGDWLWRLGQMDKARIPDILQSHPDPDKRAAALRQFGLERLGPPLLSEDEFRALRAICG